MDELYDLQEDPDEIHNRIDDPDYAQVEQEMRDALWELMMQYDDPYAEHRCGAARYLKAHSKGLVQEYHEKVSAEKKAGRREWLKELRSELGY